MAKEILTPYRQVAMSAYMAPWHGFTEDEAKNKASRETYEEIESQTRATGSMSSAIKSIAKILNLGNLEKDFEDAVLGRDRVFMTESDQALFRKIFYEIQSGAGFYGEARNQDIIEVLSDVHNGWVEDKDNVAKFNQEKRIGKKFQHLPIEMIGWDEAKLDLAFVKPILETLGVEVDIESLSYAYGVRTRAFFKEKKLLKSSGEIDKQKLANYILQGKGVYPSLSKDNQAKDEDEAMLMASQVMQKVGQNFDRTIR